jgi:hypothetical protein
MLEVFSGYVKLFAPSGAHACSRLPGSSVRGSPLRAARFRANLTQAALAPVFPKPMASEPMALSRWSLHRRAVSVLHAEPSTRRAFYARCIRRGAWRQGEPTLHAARSSRAA